MKNLIIYGAGGHAKSVLDSLDRELYNLSGFIDNFKSGTFLDKPIFDDSFLDSEESKNYCYFVAIGDNHKRNDIFGILQKKQLEIINIIDKSAIISSSAKYGVGCFFGKQSIVNAYANIGDNAIINTRALVEHECSIGKSCHISTNTVLNGGTSIGKLCFIGSSSVVIGQLSIGEDTIVGAGAVVIDNLDKSSVYVGIPAKKIK